MKGCILGVSGGIVGTFLVLGSVAANATTLDCTAKINQRAESFKARVDAKNRLVWWSQTQMVSASPKSYFGWLSDMDNFGLEGKASFVGRNGFSVMSATNTAESIDIGVSPSLTLGFYNYRDGGSGRGNLKTPLVCKVNRE